MTMADEMIWTQRFMGLCDHVATWSEDPDFQVGCVVASPDGHEIRSTGYNGFPRGVLASEPARFVRENGEKFFWFEHAERNAIYNAARAGICLSGCILYVNRFPCADCGRAIIQAGISHIVAPPIPIADGALDYSFQVSQQMLREAGVQVTEFK